MQLHRLKGTKADCSVKHAHTTKCTEILDQVSWLYGDNTSETMLPWPDCRDQPLDTMVDTVDTGGSGQHSHGRQALDTLGLLNLNGVNDEHLSARYQHFLYAHQLDRQEIDHIWHNSHD